MDKQSANYCTNCGAALQDSAHFCAACGTAINMPPSDIPKVHKKIVDLRTRWLSRVVIFSAAIFALPVYLNILVDSSEPDVEQYMAFITLAWMVCVFGLIVLLIVGLIRGIKWFVKKEKKQEQAVPESDPSSFSHRSIRTLTLLFLVVFLFYSSLFYLKNGLNLVAPEPIQSLLILDAVLSVVSQVCLLMILFRKWRFSIEIKAK